MGSFDSTCAISRLPIHNGDKVFYYVSKENWINTTYELLGEVSEYERKKEQLATLLAGEPYPKKYESYFKRLLKHDTIEHLTAFWNFQLEDCNWECGFGEYDDYGWIEGSEFPRDRWELVFLAREDIANKIVELIPNPDTDNYLRKLVRNCYYLRIQLFGNNLLGQQGYDLEEIEYMEKFHNIILEETSKMKKEWIENFGEE